LSKGFEEGVRKACLGALLVPLVAIGFWRVSGHEFVNYDDNVYVSENPHLETAPTPRALVWALTSRYASNWHPLTWLSHMLDRWLFGHQAGAHHVTSLTIHVFNVLLLFIAFERMTGASWRAWAVAALFAVHPLHVESVAWVSERKDVLSTFFALLAVCAYARYVRRPKPARYAVVALLYTLGLMAKPMVVTLPFVLLLLDYWPLGRFGAHDANRLRVRRLLAEKLPLFGLAAVSVYMTLWAQREQALRSRADYGVGVRIANALVAYASYVTKTFWPSKLAFFYPHPGYDLPRWKTIAAAFFLAAATLSAYRWRRGRPYVFMGWLWYLITLAPVIGVVQVGNQAMADRYTYLPLVGLFIIFAWSVPDFAPRRRDAKTAFVALAMLGLAALTLCTWRQVGYWRDTPTLMRRALAVTTDNPVAHNNLGAYLLARGQPSEAAHHLASALEIYTSEAARRHKKADGKMQISIECADTYNNLGVALTRMGRREEARQRYHEALSLDPDHCNAHINLGVALAEEGKIDEAAAHFREAIRIQPYSTEAHCNLGAAHLYRGELDDASRHLKEAARLNPRNAQAHANLGTVFMHQGNPEKAAAHFTKALDLDPEHRQARSALERIRTQ